MPNRNKASLASTLLGKVRSGLASGQQAKGKVAARPTGPLRLQVTFVQYDQHKYPGALEQLIALLSTLEDIDWSLLVVDNYRPGDWSHRVSSRLTHIGGDNTAWEFSAFDKGLSFQKRSGAGAAVHALVTDAYAAYGDAFLTLFESSVIDFVAGRRAAVGWVDAWPEATTALGKTYREWVRTSFVLMPDEVLRAVQPLAIPLDEGRIFSGNPGAPFLRDAPLGEGLQSFLLEWLVSSKELARLREGWHSRFVLDPGTLPLFRSKVAAILREHMLSVRLREAGVPVYDLRLLAKLREGGPGWQDLDDAALADCQGAAWNAASTPGLRPSLVHHIDVCEWPASAKHGEPVTFRVEGWAAGHPEVSSVGLRVGERARLTGVTGLERSDVARAVPAVTSAHSGFSIGGVLADLPPGEHRITLEIGRGRSVDLGTIGVSPFFELSARRRAIPERWPLGSQVPVALEAEIRASRQVERVIAEIDGRATGLSVLVGTGERDPTERFTHDLIVSGLGPAFGESGYHRLELRVLLAGGDEERWAVPFQVVATDVACTVRGIDLGPFDPDSGLARVRLDVDALDAEPGDRLLLEREGTVVLDTALTEEPAQGSSLVRAWVTLDRECRGIPPGKGRFRLLLARGADRRVVWRGELVVPYLRPELHLERAESSLVPLAGAGAPTHRLHLSGWVKNHFLVDCLIVEIGDSRAAVLGLFELRPDVADATASPLVFRQGFDAMLDVRHIPPGEHTVHVIATQEAGERARVSRRVLFEAQPFRRISIASDDLERLLRGTSTHTYGAIVLRGQVVHREEHAVASLLVEGRVVDEQTFAGAGEHELSLRGVPASSGDYGVQMVVTARGRPVFETAVCRVAFRRQEIPLSVVQDVATVLDKFDLRPKILGLTTDRDLAARLLERQPERAPEFVEMLSTAAHKLREAGPQRRRWEPTTIAQRSRLRILFATWEVPSRYHGGGVYLRNLLMRLGALHDITLVHTYGVDEVGHVEPLRPYLKRIVSVPRVFRPAQYRGAGRFPLHLYDVYIPELRNVLELEARSGGYDLVDYEYSSMGPYVPAGLPSVLTVHEVGYTALLGAAFQTGRTVEAAVPQLDQLVRSFHYFSTELPSIVRHLVTLTEEDASALTAYADAKVYTNPSGADVDGVPLSLPLGPGGAPLLSYVGNFQHPPNARAVLYFAEKVMPALRERFPDAELRVYGTRISNDVRALDGQGGVRVLGFVEDLRSALRASTAMVAPLFTGTGMRIKVIEALGAGALVIGTDLSVRGLGVIDGTHFFRANTPDEFVDAICRAALDPRGALTVARAGQDLVAASYSWEATAKRREAIWFAALADAAREGSTEAPAAHRGADR